MPYLQGLLIVIVQEAGLFIMDEVQLGLFIDVVV